MPMRESALSGELPRGPAARVTVSAQAEPGGPLFGWSSALALTPNGRLAEAWRLRTWSSDGEQQASSPALGASEPPLGPRVR